MLPSTGPTHPPWSPMSMNVTLFEQWLSDGTIRLGRGKLLAVEPAPKRPHFDFGRVEGMMLGLAIGDSLGNSSESLLPSPFLLAAACSRQAPDRSQARRISPL